MRYARLALLATVTFFPACEGDDARDPDDPRDDAGRICLTDPVCTDAMIMDLGALPEATRGTNARVAMLGDDVFVAYRDNQTLHTAQWHEGTWTALPTVATASVAASYDLVVHADDVIFWVLQSRGETSIVRYDGSTTTQKSSPPVLAPPESVDTFNASDVSVHALYTDDDQLIVARAATFNTGSASAGVSTYIVREALLYDVAADTWTSLGSTADASATPASDRASTYATTSLATVPSVGWVIATRTVDAIAVDLVTTNASYTVQDLDLSETPDFLGVTASEDGELSVIWSTSGALRITTSNAITRGATIDDAGWTLEGSSLSDDGSQGVAITYAGDAPVIAYAATSHDPQMRLRWWNAVDWIPFGQIGSDLLATPQAKEPSIAADNQRICVAWTEIGSTSTNARVSCFGR